MAGSVKRPHSELQVVHRHAAGIDIGSRFHAVAVPKDRDNEPVRCFGTFTGDLHALADWLVSCAITTVAMESTSVYWLPVYEILESRGLEVLLVNARFAKNVPGRKTDISDAQWLQRLHEHGLLRGSFRPREAVATLRALLRHRERLGQYRASHVQHMQKALMQMNVQLHHVVTDITGATGLAIIRAIVGGERDPQALARLRDKRCKESESQIAAALRGNYRIEHLLSLRHALELFDVYGDKIKECDTDIECALTTLNQGLPLPEDELTKPRSKARSRNEPDFQVRTLLHTLLGVDLTQIHGVGALIALQLVGECGDDMSRWRTEKQFTAWLGLAPQNKISGGKVLSSRTAKTSSRAAHLFRMAAQSLARSETALGAYYRRLGGRIGKAKAITATARKLAILFYRSVRDRMRYKDPGVTAYDTQHRARVLRNLQRRARSLGFEVIEPAQTNEVGHGVS